MKEKILITGGAGFLGLEAYEFFKKKYDLVLLDIISSQNPKIYNIDITNYDKLNNFIGKIKPNIILHFASEIFDSKNKNLINRVNVDGTFNLVKSCEENKIKKILFTSTFSIYEKNYNYLIKENEPISCKNDYGISKSETERILLSSTKDIDIVIFRCPVILGKTRSHRVGILFELLKNNMPLFIFGDGNNKIQFLSSFDLFKLMEKSFSLKGKMLFNAGCNRVNSIKDTFEFLIKKTKSKSRIIFINKILGNFLLNILIFFKLIDLNHYHQKLLVSNIVMDTSKMMQTLKYKIHKSTAQYLLDSYNANISEYEKNFHGSSKKPRMKILALLRFFYRIFCQPK